MGALLSAMARRNREAQAPLLPQKSNFCCLPGRAGGTLTLVGRRRAPAFWLDATRMRHDAYNINGINVKRQTIDPLAKPS